jgi:8-oxo-dGTP diphosphatase
MLLHNGKMTKAGKDVLPVEWAAKESYADKTPGRKIANAVGGILMGGKKFLVEKRREDDDADPGFIEIHGGHVDNGETFEDALRREMKEELGIHVERAKPVQSSLYTATNGERGRIHYFLVERWKGRIVSKEAERVYWESDPSSLSIIPDRRAVRRILQLQNHAK